MKVEAPSSKPNKSIEDVEAKPRVNLKLKQLSKNAHKLPVKKFDGSVCRNELHDDLKEEVDSDPSTDAEEGGEESDAEAPTDRQDTPSEIPDMTADPVEKLLYKKRNLFHKKSEIAALCHGLLESPETALKRSKENPVSQLQQLHNMCEDEDPVVCRLAMLSELSVYVDILPGYRINLATVDPKVRMKKAVKDIHEYEVSLLANYQRYLKFLSASSTSSDPKLVETTLRCMTGLLREKPHFNFNYDLVTGVISFADSSNPAIRCMVVSTFEQLFKEDRIGRVSSEIVKQISRYAKKHKFR
jgi:nucleolar complex protein 3